ncbi:1-acyl-sn-glycerol-3-phosphate acyltransferase [Nodosilinea sp. LEGE 07298]|uniref:lysophospholipid acyltransferase family protein n=1 Tax=Nodosilinea sp. LEGE 07298 TaxID=2777970 RepID=UPI001880F576|nr:1-acyl-sn-glycerol-3-phosphate acyltransferase [Nodosilinea sp. LEGE 07298]MBE9111759.1 1-acyl-sn-glycerol-3-phosphate acyltransferase [Nodosilinea sp. LEGE 07298]
MKSSEFSESSAAESKGGAMASESGPLPTAPVRSRCSPVLTPLAYFLGQHLVVPAYFSAITITGQDRVPTAGPVILAPTHRARWDSILLPFATGRHVTGRDLRFMVTADEVKGLQGWFIRRLGGFAVNVRRPTVASLRYGIDLLIEGEMLVIYPEGGIRRDDRVHGLKPGLARLAVQAEAAESGLGLQVLPVDISYGEAYPNWRCPAQIHIGEPLLVQGYLKGQDTPEVLKAGAQQLTKDLQAQLEAMVASRQAIVAADPSLPAQN